MGGGPFGPGPAPVVVIEHAELESAGFVTLGEFAANLPLNWPEPTAQYDTIGATGSDLRGLGVDATLTLMAGELAAGRPWRRWWRPCAIAGCWCARRCRWRWRWSRALQAGRDGENLLLRVEDRGPGIPDDLAASFGRRYISRKEGGLGLGVLLSSVTIERLGGEVTLLERPGGGTRLEIRLPPAQMAAS